MKLRRTYINRRQIKNSEGEFIWELDNSYELSPKLSFLILCQGIFAAWVHINRRSDRNNINRDRRAGRKNNGEDGELME